MPDSTSGNCRARATDGSATTTSATARRIETTLLALTAADKRRARRLHPSEFRPHDLAFGRVRERMSKHLGRAMRLDGDSHVLSGQVVVCDHHEVAADAVIEEGDVDRPAE